MQCSTTGAEVVDQRHHLPLLTTVVPTAACSSAHEGCRALHGCRVVAVPRRSAPLDYPWSTERTMPQRGTACCSAAQHVACGAQHVACGAQHVAARHNMLQRYSVAHHFAIVSLPCQPRSRNTMASSESAMFRTSGRSCSIGRERFRARPQRHNRSDPAPPSASPTDRRHRRGRGGSRAQRAALGP